MERVVRRISPGTPLLLKKKQVAAYARVSSGKDAMLHSLSAQISYYSEYIQKHREWQYAGVYADEALTGTKDSRAEFQHLLNDCRAGLVDMVITKSISRFARNTVTMLETLRELKLINVDVFFEKENIHSMSGDGELMLTILASFAQEESRSVSENVKWRIRKRFQNGELVNLRFAFGYRIEKNKIETDPAQAEIVRMIFADYIGGSGCGTIANKLNQMGVLTVRKNKWNDKRVADIIKNEKYAGNSLLQKKYVADHLTKALVKNKGALPKYYAENTHPPIVDAATFQRAQVILAERIQRNAGKKEAGHYPFTGKIICGKCGKKYKRKTDHGRISWNCSTYLERGRVACHTKQIPEAILVSFAAEALGITRFDEVAFDRQIKEIYAPGSNLMVFVFYDGRTVQKEWQNKPRSESWNGEARRLARERQLKHMERR